MKTSKKTTEAPSFRSNKEPLRQRLKQMLAKKKLEPIFPLINPTFQPYRRIIE